MTRYFQPLLLAGLLLCSSTAAKADAVNDAITAEMKALATDLKPYLDKQRYKTISVGGFAAPSKVQGSAGLGLQVKLSEALTGLGYSIDSANYEVEIRGEYRPLVEEHAFGASILIKLYDEFGTPLFELEGNIKEEVQYERELFGTEAVPQLFGLPVETKPTADYSTRSQEYKDAYKNPQFHINGCVIANSDKSPYAIEVLVKRNGEYVPVTPETKTSLQLPFAPIQKQEVYAVRLINNSQYEAAVDLTIDGLSSFTFGEQTPKPNFWLVPAGKSVLVRGWMINDKDTFEFKVVDFPETAVAKTGLKTHPSIGLIQASFSAAWIVDKDNPNKYKPTDEESSRGTGFGDKIENKIERVQRAVGHPRENIVVRYERAPQDT